MRVGVLGGLGKATQDDFLRGVMDYFTQKKIYTAGSANQKSALLTYWKNWGKNWGIGTSKGIRNGSTDFLLAEKDSNCDAWTKFFFDVLRAQGVTFQDNLFAIASKTKNEFLFVKSWTANRAPRQKEPLKGYPFLNTFKKSFFRQAGNNKAWEYVWDTADVDHVPNTSLKGQGYPVTKLLPRADFRNHILAKLVLSGKVVLFDPSYGELYESDKQGAAAIIADLVAKLDARAIDFYGFSIRPGQMSFRVNGADTDLNRIDARLGTAAINNRNNTY